jgi:undecaprenyl-phosphate galactose phosphotransferase
LFPAFKRLEKFVLFKKWKLFREKVLIVGNENQKKKLIKEIRDNWYLGMQSSNYVYDYVFIATQNLSVERVNELFEQYSNVNKRLYLIPYVTNINFAHSDILEYINLRLNSIVVENKLLNKLNILIKGLFDYLIAVLLMPFFLLVHLIISILIKLDSPGNVFFKQKRVGKNGKIFYVYKYRTMYENSQKLLEEYLKKHPEEIKYYEKYHKYKNDPRITKIGKILRITSLDELPQIINVLKGEMSLVGPRPYMLNELDKLGKYKEFILKVKPGLTGLWQVSGRNNLTFKERNELEVWYIKNWSLWLDLVILIKTFKVVVFKIGAK